MAAPALTLTLSPAELALLRGLLAAPCLWVTPANRELEVQPGEGDIACIVSPAGAAWALGRSRSCLPRGAMSAEQAAVWSRVERAAAAEDIEVRAEGSPERLVLERDTARARFTWRVLAAAAIAEAPA